MLATMLAYKNNICAVLERDVNELNTQGYFPNELHTQACGREKERQPRKTERAERRRMGSNGAFEKQEEAEREKRMGITRRRWRKRRKRTTTTATTTGSTLQGDNYGEH